MSGALLAALGGAPDLVATVSPASVNGFRIGAGFVQTGVATVAIVSGVAPFTQLWTRVSGTAFNIDSPTTLTCTWSTTYGSLDDETSLYQCVVTDSLGRSTPPLQVTARLVAS